MIYFNKKEALRYFRAQPGDAQAGAAIDVAYEKLRNELQPRYTVKRFGCRADAASVLLDNGTVFRSKALARYVGEATELFLFGATLGSRVDIALRRMALTSWRFSPGYGDWALEEQKILFPVLDCAHTIGLTLTESCMMAPVKSVTAVIAITEDDVKEDKVQKDKSEKTFLKKFNCNQTDNYFSNTNNKCLHCNKVDCEFRQK